MHGMNYKQSDRAVCVFISDAKCMKFKGNQPWNNTNLPVSLSVLSSYVLFERKLMECLIQELETQR